MSAQLPTDSAAAAPSLTQALVARLQRPVDTRARRRAALHWLDWMACVGAALRSDVAGVLQRWQMPAADAATGGPAPWASLSGHRASDFQAIVADAGLANVLEMDDLDRQALMHPGPVVLPVAAHLARHAGLSAAATLDAVVRGYEAAVRVGRTLGPAHYRIWHNTATAGVFGAAAAAADGLRLDARAFAWALGHAGTQAAGLWQVRLEPVMSKQLHTGHAAWAGLSAASLAGAGLSGPLRILEGELGFYAALCPDAQPARLLEPAADWRLHETSFKPWPSCRHAHPTIDAVLEIRRRRADAPLAITEARVHTFGDAVSICAYARPRTPAERRFSLAWAVAAAARWGPLAPWHFDDDAARDDVVAKTLERVHVHEDPALSRSYPAHFGARVTLVLADGSVHEAQATDALGDPESPMSQEQLIGKARRLLAYGGVPAPRIAAIVEAVQHLCAADDARLAAEPMPAALLQPLLEATPAAAPTA